ncbi:PREDICTED: uncharacterized protein LOC107328455 [Acropora digitifera]|uniref:uncharacterized protein LOC107328455 n=1 Tax=Acropora digitifera TaxID=70779 RepID=UPI00077A35C3|nr:PREDICTED: uncharacterized protein LOC107328455 [Acropora digitifera]
MFPSETEKQQSVRDELIKSGDMTPFGGTLGSLQGANDSEASKNELGMRDLGREILSKESHGSKNKRTESDEKQKYLIKSFADGVKSDSSDDNDDEYVPDESELKYSWYEDEPDEREGKMLQRGKKSAAMWKQSLNVTYREDDAVTPKKKKKKKKTKTKTKAKTETTKKTTTTARKMGDTKPLDDGSEKVYRQRIR